MMNSRGSLETLRRMVCLSRVTESSGPNQAFEALPYQRPRLDDLLSDRHHKNSTEGQFVQTAVLGLSGAELPLLLEKHRMAMITSHRSINMTEQRCRLFRAVVSR